MTKSKRTVLSIAYTALGAALMAVCAWVTVPFTVPFTLQTFAVFASAGILGWKRGVASVLIYMAIGVLGAPVFSGFRAGPGVLLGTTGGYIVGFVFTALIVGLAVDKLGAKLPMLIISMVLGLAVCYLFGTVWFVQVYARKVGEMGFASALMTCVVPYLAPDAAKIAVAALIVPRLRKIISGK